MASGPQPTRYAYERMGATRSPAIPTWPGSPAKAWPNQGAIVDNGPGSPAAMDGLPLAGLSAILVTAYICNQMTPSGALSLTGDTFAGGGILAAWIGNPWSQTPVRYPDLDLAFNWPTTNSVAVAARGTRGWPMLYNVGRLGVYLWYTSVSVTFTGVTTADFVLRMDGFSDVGGVH